MYHFESSLSFPVVYVLGGADLFHGQPRPRCRIPCRVGGRALACRRLRRGTRRRGRGSGSELPREEDWHATRCAGKDRRKASPVPKRILRALSAGDDYYSVSSYLPEYFLVYFTDTTNEPLRRSAADT